MARSQLCASSLAVAAVLLLGTHIAAAQPGLAPPSSQPPQPPPASKARPAMATTWGIGLHVGTAELASSANPDDKTDLGGGGVHFRYRFNHRFSIEISVDRLTGEYAPGIDRDSRPVTLSGLIHLTSNPRWNFYILGGIGGSRDLIKTKTASGNDVEIEYRQTHIHLGGGIEHRWAQFGFGAELRLIGAGRNNDYNAGSSPNGPIPEESSGAMFTLAGTFYF